MKSARCFASGVLLLACVLPGRAAEDLASLYADRAAIERIYYNHRLGDKPPFETLLPRSRIERLVRDELHKETVLKQVYGLEISPEQVQAEVNRINITTRAPQTLQELKEALGNEPTRFARTIARPIVVERELRRRFENDSPLHAPQRKEAEQARAALLSARHAGASTGKLLELLRTNSTGSVKESVWQLSPRPQEAVSLHPESTDAKSYFEDFPSELQRVLCAQLKTAGDVSAIIETPQAFLLFVAQEKTTTTLSAAWLTVQKRGYEDWLAKQPPKSN